MSSTKKKKMFVLDTCVLMSNPFALFAFEEHDVFLPIQVIEELDNNKQGLRDQQRNARMALRIIDVIARHQKSAKLSEGCPLAVHPNSDTATGKLYFEGKRDKPIRPSSFTDESKGDNRIIATTLALKEQRFNAYSIVLVSLDVGMRIKCLAEGIECELFLKDAVVQDEVLFAKGYTVLPNSYFEGLEFRTEQILGGIRYLLPLDCNLTLSKLVRTESGEPFTQGIVREIVDGCAAVDVLKSYSNGRALFGLNALNFEQDLALGALMDPAIDLVILTGPAGTGKTLLAVAAGLAQVIGPETNHVYDEIIVTRIVVPAGKHDIGFLPGTEEEKMAKWLRPIDDAIDVLGDSHERSGRTRSPSFADSANMVIQRESFTLVRGRTYHKRYVIVDEAQNMLPHDMLTLVTRAGERTKYVIMGNNSQIDDEHISPHNSGLSVLIDRFKEAPNCVHIMLDHAVRSRLATLANERLS
jgi:PhoH-like ATPase